MIKKISREKNMIIAIDSIYTTSYYDYSNHWDIYKQKKKDLEVCFTDEANENYVYDTFITNAMEMFYYLECDSKVDKITMEFKKSYSNKITCSYIAYIDLEYIDSDFTSDQVNFSGEATLIKENGKWKINYMQITSSNISEIYSKKKAFDEN